MKPGLVNPRRTKDKCYWRKDQFNKHYIVVCLEGRIME